MITNTKASDKYTSTAVVALCSWVEAERDNEKGKERCFESLLWSVWSMVGGSYRSWVTLRKTSVLKVWRPGGLPVARSAKCG